MRILMTAGLLAALTAGTAQVDEIDAMPSEPEKRLVQSGPLHLTKLPRAHARLEGTTLVVDIPKGARPDSASALVDIDLSPIAGHCLEMRIRARGRGVGRPSVGYKGLKFMLCLEDEDGTRTWPGCPHRTGDWADELVTVCDLAGHRLRRATLQLGLQECEGRVEFDLSSFRLFDAGIPFPLVNRDWKVKYPPAVGARGRLRGVMLPGDLKAIKEDDFATLEKWGATLVRYQIPKGWNSLDAWLDNADYDAYIDEALDILETRVLPWAEKHGQLVCIDLHATPGARCRAKENRMFYEKAYADHFVETWRRIARRFRGDRRLYGYDLVNEPQQLGPAPQSYLHVQLAAARAIREIDPVTPIIVAANGFGSPSGFRTMSPLRMDNVIYQSHSYQPMGFTHQGTHGGPKDNLKEYPNPKEGWDRETIRRSLQPVRDFQLRHNAKIYIGEFSAITWAKGADRYIRDSIEIFEEYGWDWCYHAFREWPGWSVEHEWSRGKNGRDVFTEVPDTSRKRALLEGFKRTVR